MWPVITEKNPKMRRARNQEAVLLEEGRDWAFIKMSIASARFAMEEGGGRRGEEGGGKGVATLFFFLSFTHSRDVLLCTNTAMTQRREKHENAGEHSTGGSVTARSGRGARRLGRCVTDWGSEVWKPVTARRMRCSRSSLHTSGHRSPRGPVVGAHLWPQPGNVCAEQSLKSDFLSLFISRFAYCCFCVTGSGASRRRESGIFFFFFFWIVAHARCG